MTYGFSVRCVFFVVVDAADICALRFVFVLLQLDLRQQLGAGGAREAEGTAAAASLFWNKWRLMRIECAACVNVDVTFLSLCVCVCMCMCVCVLKGVQILGHTIQKLNIPTAFII